MNYQDQIAIERPLSEGDQIKAAIREMFETSRTGSVYSEEHPFERTIKGVNGTATKTLNVHKHPTKKGAIVMWYD